MDIPLDREINLGDLKSGKGIVVETRTIVIAKLTDNEQRHKLRNIKKEIKITGIRYHCISRRIIYLLHLLDLHSFKFMKRAGNLF